MTYQCFQAPHRCGVQGAVPGTWSDVCGFLKPPDSYERWKVRQHGALPMPHEALGVRQTDQSLPPTRRGFTWTLWSKHNGPCSRQIRTTPPLERTLGAVPLKQTKVQSRRGCQRPVWFLHGTRETIHHQHSAFTHGSLHKRSSSSTCHDSSSSRPSAFDLMRRHPLPVACCVFPHSVLVSHVTSHLHVTLSTQLFVSNKKR